MAALIDSHAHLDDDQYRQDLTAVIERAKEANIQAIINPAQDMATSRKAIQLALENEMIYSAIGFHPHEAHQAAANDYDQLAEWSQQEKVVAIGELGLDYYYDYSPREQQQQVLIRQLDLARQVHLPIIVHDRDAHEDIFNIIKNEGKGLAGVFHCFSGSWEMARQLLNLGFYLSFGGPVTFKNAVKVKGIVEKMPLDRLLIETDSPYLSPHPLRGKRNEPLNVQIVAQEIAAIRKLDIEEVAAITTDNTKRLFLLNI